MAYSLMTSGVCISLLQIFTEPGILLTSSMHICCD